jgi:hypothetical protein
VSSLEHLLEVENLGFGTILELARSRHQIFFFNFFFHSRVEQ